MSTDRLSMRAMLAVLLAGSALLFFIGIYLERGAATSTEPAVAKASAAPPSAAPVEGSGGEAGEAGHSPTASAGAAAATAGEGTGETAGEHAAETWPLGLNLEAPPLVGGVILVSLTLAVAVVVTTSPIVSVAIVGFAALFGLFDLLEVVHQAGRNQPGLVAIAVVLLVAHTAAGLIALRILAKRRPALPLVA